MSRRDAILVWVAFWAFWPLFIALVYWPLYVGPLLLAALFFGTLYLAIFEWPGSEP